MRVAVVGAGIAGASAAVALALRGHEVRGFEQFSRGHVWGSSHGHSRIIRKTYPDRFHTGLMLRAYPLWEHWQELAGEAWVERSGILYLGPEDHPDLKTLADALDHHRVPWELWEPARSLEEAGLCLSASEVGIYQPEAGMVRASRAVSGLLELSERLGAVWTFDSRVDQIRPESSGVVVVSGEGDWAVDSVVICAGPWVRKWLPADSTLFTVTRQVWAYAGDDSSDGPKMVWIDARSLAYGFPADGHVPGFKIAHHVPGSTADPDAIRHSPPDRLAVDALAPVALKRLGIATALHDVGTCLYTNTPDGMFAVGHAGDARIPVISPCSGHGFKFGPLVGEWAADAIETGAWAECLRPFQVERFSVGSEWSA